MSGFHKLIEWHISKCDGDWEHQSGFEILTYDNPAIGLKIKIDDTELDNTTRKLVWNNEDEKDWIVAQIIDGRYEATSSLNNYEMLFEIFFKEVVKA